ncbi:MAG: PadR family transcriptional regulator [Phycisphaerae bacterium]|jgi:PadR family transcriptional regulator PadR|nr:PadR family transcriptional regulator [Phycisphaerae bacterium]
MARSTADGGPEFLSGTLEMLILRTLEAEELHGYGIARAIEAASGARLSIEEGSLYPALHRLEKRGDVRPEWKVSPTNRRARYYSLTQQGKKHLKKTTTAWLDVSAAVNRVLGLVPANQPTLGRAEAT